METRAIYKELNVEIKREVNYTYVNQRKQKKCVL